MRLERLDLTAFGHFSGLTLDFGKTLAKASASSGVNADPVTGDVNTASDFHIVYGDNEAGKSTTLSAIVELLFGMPVRSTWNFVHANEVLEIGARLWQSNQGGAQTLDVRRLKNRLLDAEGSRLNEIIIDTHGLSRDAFRARFSLDDQVLEEGSEAILRQEGDLGAALFGASSGLSDISARLDEAMESANAFWQPKKTSTIELPKLRKELDELRNSRKEHELDAREWKRLRKAIDAQRERCELTAASLRSLETTLKRHERDRIAIGRAFTLKDRRAHLETLQKPPKWPGTRPRSASFEIQRLVKADAEIAAARKQLQQDSENVATLIVDTKVLDAQERIESLQQQHDTLTSQRAERPALEEQKLAMEHRLQSLSEPLAVLPTAANSAGPLTRDTIDRLDQLAREYATLSAEHQSAGSEARRAEEALANHAGSDATVPGNETTSVLELAAESKTPDQPVMALDEVRLTRLKAKLDAITEAAPSARLDEAQSSLHALEQERDEAMRQLLPWQGAPATLLTMSLPVVDTLDSVDKRLAEVNERQRQTLKTRSDSENARTAIAEQQALDKANRGVDPMDIEASGALRDRCFNELQSAVEAERPHAELTTLLASLRAALSGHDALVRQQVANSEASARIQEAASRISAERTRLEQLDSTLLTIDRAFGTCQEELDAGNRDIGLPSPSSADLRDWLRKRDQTLDCERRVKQAQAELQQRHDELNAAACALAQALSPCLDNAAQDTLREGLPMPDLLSIGRQSLAHLLETQEASIRELAEQQRLNRDFRQRERAVLTTIQALEHWQPRWQRAASSTAYENDWTTVPAETLIDLLPTLRKFSECHQELNQSQAALIVLDQRIGQFNEDVLSLAKRLNPEPSIDPVHHDASLGLGSIKRRLADSLKAQTEFGRSEARQSALIEEIATLEAQSEPVRGQVHTMMQLASTRTSDDLQQSLEAMAQYDDVQLAISELEEDLQRTLAPESLPDELERLHLLDVEALDVDIAHLSHEIAKTREQLSEEQQERMRLELSTEGVADDDTVATLTETRENLLLDIEERARDALSLRLGKLAVEAALRRYRDAHRSTMMRHARESFKELTRGHYVDLRAQAGDKGLERLIGIRGNGVSLQASQMSKGTRFQLFLALRIAAYHEYADQRTPLPFIADDILESSDDQRTQAAISQLHAMSRRGQVIYLTHHRHLVDIAREQCGDEVRIHQLG